LKSLISLSKVPPVIPECTATDGAHNDQENKDYKVNIRHLLPNILEGLQ
jgi:hypothetical protein